MDLLIFQVPILMVQASMDGILLGILFALIAYGMALQWGVMNIINIAQGDLVILGRYIAYFMYIYGIHPAWGVIVSPIIMYFVGIGIYKLVINKVVDRDLFISILATFGINAALCGVAGALISITFTIHPYMGLPYTIRSFMIVIVAGLGNVPGVAISGMGLGVFEEFADYILGTEFRIGSVFLLLVLILVYRRFKLSKKREYLK